MLSSDSKGKKVKRKQAVLQTRKSLGGKKGSGDDDFVPIKAATTKRKPPTSKPVKSAAKEEGLSESEQKDKVKAKETKTEVDRTIKAAEGNSKPKRKTVVRNKVVEDSESDDDLFLDDTPPAKKAPNRKATAKKKVESDDEMVDLFQNDAPPTKKAPNRKATAKAKVESDGEMDVDTLKAQTKGKEKESTKRKR